MAAWRVGRGLAVLAALLVLAAAMPALGQAEYHWAEPLGGDYSLPANWLVDGATPANAPGASDLLVFDLAGEPYAVNVDLAMAVADRAAIHAGDLVWLLAGGMALTGQGPSLYVSRFAADNARLTVGEGDLNCSGTLSVGDEAGAVGELLLDGWLGDPITLSVGSNSVYDSTIYLGREGVAYVTLDGAATLRAVEHVYSPEGWLTSPWVIMGEGEGAYGQVEVYGPDARFEIDHAPVIVGDRGSGEIYLYDGAAMTMGEGELWLGLNEGSSGSLTLDGGGASLVQASAYPSIVGRGGSGTLSLDNGAGAVFSQLWVGGADYRNEPADLPDGNLHLGFGQVLIYGGWDVDTDCTVESDTGVLGSAADAVSDPANPIESYGLVEIIASGISQASWTIHRELELGGHGERAGGQGEVYLSGPLSSLKVGADGGSFLRVWPGGRLDITDGRAALGSDALPGDPGVFHVAEGTLLDLRGGAVSVRAYDESTDQNLLSRILIDGEALGWGTLEADVALPSGCLRNESGLTLDIAGVVQVAGEGEAGVTVRGAGSTMRIGGTLAEEPCGLMIGGGGQWGYVDVFEGGDLVVDNGVAVGGFEGGSGSLTIGDNAAMTVNNRLVVGRYGEGSLTVAGGGSLVQPSSDGRGLCIGDLSPGTGWITGQGSSVQAVKIFIGDSSSGDVHVEDGATVQCAGPLVMGRMGHRAVLVLAGGGSLESHADPATGRSGVISSCLTPQGGEFSSVLVDGGQWTQDGELIVADNAGALGELTVSNGGAVNSAALTIGRRSYYGSTEGAKGFVYVREAGSTLSAGEIGLGGETASVSASGVDAPGGYGLMVIADGARVEADAMTVFAPSELQLEQGVLDCGQLRVAGLLCGWGQIAGGVETLADSRLAPGLDAAGRLEIGGDLALRGRTEIDLFDLTAGEYDRLAIDGQVAYGGTLSLNFPSGAALGDSAAVFTFGSVAPAAEFDAVEYYGLPEELKAVFDPATGVVNVTTLLMGGDANGDGHVNIDDFVILKRHYNTSSGATWEQGDFTFDGAVDIDDFVILKRNYNR